MNKKGLSKGRNEMTSLELSDLIFTLQYDSKELGYYPDVSVLLECLSELLTTRAAQPQQVETLECHLLQELTKGCVKV